ncbi:hypothetical protein SAXI111661_06220 [Saccharomonospora xinjiangensis]|uniref:hypothetical protein n=1 Tax=Saccharomonospora xinjiangensis TaxID=75294 RepID=UPI00106F4840|nr:hypothetical protein [Saccharomonospora xinjiangensis]QBQ58701.1 hypothetical protein EYD13_01570 [Saccharomonospora xinjiangensis]
MTRDSDGGRPQKTVAELLAEHGGKVGDTPRRRRRRAAEDDAPGARQPGLTDTAPQAIIDRVRAEGPPPGAAAQGSRPKGRSPEADEQARGRSAAPRTGPQKVPAPPRTPQGTGAYPAPGAGEGSTRQSLPPRGQARSAQAPASSAPPTQSSLPPSTAHSTGYGKPTTNGFRLPPKQQNSGANPVPPGGAPQGGGTTGGLPVPPGPQAPASSSQQTPQPDAASRMSATRRVPAPPPPPAAQEGTLAARLDGLGDVEEQEQSAAPPAPPASGPPQRSSRFALPPRRRRPPRGAPAPDPEPHTEQLPAVGVSDAEQTALSEPVRADAPPAGLASWPGRPGPAGPVPGRVDRQGGPDPSLEETQVHAPAALDDDGSGEGPDTGYYVPDFDDDSDDSEDLDAATRVGALADDPLADGTYGAYGDEPYTDHPDAAYDDYDDDAAEYDAEYDGPEGNGQHDRRDGDTGAAGIEAGDTAEEGSPAKQWLLLAGQLALGVAGGAGVWLGFNWLWGQLPAAALIAALLVTVGLVWIVRKVRKAEDTQTTVLALLVGLVVTVSPAALLLVSR